MLRTVTATEYVTPLREGGSLPAIVGADDDGTYVVKFRGAGQGVRALAAEVISGEIARALGLPVPEIVLVQLDGRMARTEPDAEISRAHMSAFVAFARTGNPNNPRIPEWKPYDAARRATMVVGQPLRVVDDWRGGDRRTSAMLPLLTTYQTSSGPLLGDA